MRELRQHSPTASDEDEVGSFINSNNRLGAFGVRTRFRVVIRKTDRCVFYKFPLRWRVVGRLIVSIVEDARMRALIWGIHSVGKDCCMLLMRYPLGKLDGRV